MKYQNSLQRKKEKFFFFRNPNQENPKYQPSRELDSSHSRGGNSLRFSFTSKSNELFFKYLFENNVNGKQENPHLLT